MTSEEGETPQPQRAESIFEGLLAREVRGESLDLEQEFARHPELADELGEMREDWERIGAILEHPFSKVGADSPDVDPVDVDRYRILERLGSGGMGTVYLAEERHPVRREVAIKLLRDPVPSEEAARRLQAECQALALLGHPHIARVYSAGKTAFGRPYLVMERVPGQHLTDFCDDRKLDLRARVALLATVCRAVEHAHSRAIVHRDLKPRNILVTEVDDAPFPRVIDFGLAKSLGARLTEGTLHTGAGRMMGTPEYMAPEQLEAGGIDGRVDVYALGAILYELACGTPPFDPLELRSCGVATMVRRIREEQVPLLRQRCAARVRRWPAEPALLRAVERVSAKALQKLPADRYPSAAAFREDLERALADRPVHAGDSGLLERAGRKLLHWRPQLAVAGLLLLAMLGAYSVGLLSGPSRAAPAAAFALTRAIQRGDEPDPRDLDLVSELLPDADARAAFLSNPTDPAVWSAIEAELATMRSTAGRPSFPLALLSPRGLVRSARPRLTVDLGTLEPADAASIPALVLQVRDQQGELRVRPWPVDEGLPRASFELPAELALDPGEVLWWTVRARSDGGATLAAPGLVRVERVASTDELALPAATGDGTLDGLLRASALLAQGLAGEALAELDQLGEPSTPEYASLALLQRARAHLLRGDHSGVEEMLARSGR